MTVIGFTFKNRETAKAFEKVSIENFVNGEVERCSSDSWMMQFPSEVTVDEAWEQVEDFLACYSFYRGTDYEFD
jgi:hypothetical protein